MVIGLNHQRNRQKNRSGSNQTNNRDIAPSPINNSNSRERKNDHNQQKRRNRTRNFSSIFSSANQHLGHRKKIKSNRRALPSSMIITDKNQLREVGRQMRNSSFVGNLESSGSRNPGHLSRESKRNMSRSRHSKLKHGKRQKRKSNVRRPSKNKLCLEQRKSK